MVIVKLLVQCRIEEVSPIGKFLIDTMNANLASFTAYSSDFNAAYLTNANTKLAAVDALINPKQYTAELKVITVRIYTNMNDLKGKINFLEGYIKRATGLTIAAKDFGIQEVRKAYHKGDVEGLIGALSFLLSNVNNNMAAIVAKGYTPAQHTALNTIKTNLTNDNAAQNAKENERNNKVVANYGLINDFWVICTDISDAGKRIFKTSAANKVNDFTIAELKRRIRQEQKKNKFTGVVSVMAPPPPAGTGAGTEQASKVFAGVTVELIPVTAGRRRVTKSDAKGKYEIKSLTEGEYIANFTASDADSKSINIVIETGKTTTMDMKMVAKAGSELAKILK